MRMFLPEVLPPVAEGMPVETFLSTEDVEDLRRRKDGKELIVISLLDLLQLQFYLITLLH